MIGQRRNLFPIRGAGLDRQVLPVPLQGERPIVEVLLRHDRQVEQRRAVTGTLRQRQIEMIECVLRPPALQRDDPQSIQRFGMTRAQFEGCFEAFFRQVEPPQGQLGLAKFKPAVGPFGLKQRVAGQLIHRRRGIVLFQMQAAQVVMRGGQFVIASQRLAVGAQGLCGLPAAVISQPEMVPSLRVFRQQAGRLLKLLDGNFEVPFADGPFALQKRGRPRRAATENKKRTGRQENERPVNRAEFFIGRHSLGW